MPERPAAGPSCGDGASEVIVVEEDHEAAPPRSPGGFAKVVSKNQTSLFLSEKRRLKNLRQKRYREKKKAEKKNNQVVNLTTWEKLGGPPKKSMRVHQYDLEYLKRIVNVGTCPAARGALSHLADILSHVTC